MNKKILILTAAMAVALTACGPKEQEDDAVDTASPVPSAAVTAAPTPVSTAVPPAETPEASESAAPVTETPQESETAVEPAASPAVESPVLDDPDPISTSAADHPARNEKNVPTDEEVLSRYRAADEAYRWFAICTLSGDPDDTQMEGELLYTRVADPRFPTMESLRGYLKTLFSDEVVDGLLPCDGTQYMDFDGGLYVSEGARGSDTSKGGVTLMVIWPEGEEPVSCTVRATVELLDWPDGSDEPVVIGEQIYEFPYQLVGDKWVFTQFESIF